jgi:transcriptional antiterminator RfaH
MDKRWYVIRTHAGAESHAEARLLDQRYGVYCPRMLSRRRRFGRRVQIVAPLFPQYLFVEISLGLQTLSPIRSTKGVLELVRFGEEYASLSRDVIAGLREREDPTMQCRRLDEPLPPQTRVRITGGPFEHLEGIYLTESPDDRVTLLLNLLGRETRVQLESALVVRA